MTEPPRRRPRTSGTRDGLHAVGIEVRCERCAETVRGMVCLDATYEEAFIAAQDMADVEARDRGWRVQPNGAWCPRCKTPPGSGA